MAYIRKSSFVKVEAEGISPEGKELKISITSDIKAGKLSPDGLRGSDIAAEIARAIEIIASKIQINYDSLTSSKTEDRILSKQLTEELDKPKKVDKEPSPAKQSPFALK